MITISKRLALEYGQDRMTDNVIRTWEALPMSYRAIGLSWYPDAHDYTCSVARVYQQAPRPVAFAAAALSPSLSWALNKREIATVCEAFWYGGRNLALSLRSSAYRQNLYKAVDILSGIPVSWKNAHKTWGFGRLLDDPSLPDIAPIDRHSAKVCLADWTPGEVKVLSGAYPILESAYILAAKRLGIPLASIVQAATWQWHVDTCA